MKKTSKVAIGLGVLALLFVPAFAGGDYEVDHGNCAIDPDYHTCYTENAECLDHSKPTPKAGHCHSITMVTGRPDCICN